MDTAKEWSVTGNGSKIVIGLVQKRMSTIITKNDFFGWCFRIPREFTKLFWAHVLKLLFDSAMVEELRIINPFGFFIIYFVWTWDHDV
jgi:hypothetical protein